MFPFLTIRRTFREHFSQITKTLYSASQDDLMNKCIAFLPISIIYLSLSIISMFSSFRSPVLQDFGPVEFAALVRLNDNKILRIIAFEWHFFNASPSLTRLASRRVVEKCKTSIKSILFGRFPFSSYGCRHLYYIVVYHVLTQERTPWYPSPGFSPSFHVFCFLQHVFLFLLIFCV